MDSIATEELAFEVPTALKLSRGSPMVGWLQSYSSVAINDERIRTGFAQRVSAGNASSNSNRAPRRVLHAKECARIPNSAPETAGGWQIGQLARRFSWHFKYFAGLDGSGCTW